MTEKMSDDELRFDERAAQISEIRVFLERPGWSQNKLALKAGISSSTVSQILKGDYAGDIAGILRKIMSVIEHEKASVAKAIRKPDFVQTWVYLDIAYCLEMTQMDKNILILTGDAGIGKTVALKKYRGDNPSCLLVEVDPTYKDITILSDIAAAINVNPSMRKDALFKTIVEKLRDTDRMIIVDEADYLNVRALDVLRRLGDLAGIPIALVGLPGLLVKIAGVRDNLRQIFSRTFALSLKTLDKDDLMAMVRSALPDSDDEIAERFAALADGNARKLVSLLTRVQRKQILADADLITMTMIKDAAATLL